MDKTYDTAAAAIAGIASGSSIAVGGFGLVGVPIGLIRAVKAAGVRDLEVISNNCGVDDWGLGELLANGQIRRMVSSYVGENKNFADQYLNGSIELEFTPQGTLAERLRAGGAGIPAFYTASGVGTMVAEGGLPWRYAPDGSVVLESPKKEIRSFSTLGPENEYVLEQAIVPDFSLVRAARGDRYGNLVFEKSGRAFNPVVAMAGRITIAEVEELVEPGQLDPEQIHVPGIFVHRVVAMTEDTRSDLPIERRTTRPQPERITSDAADQK